MIIRLGALSVLILSGVIALCARQPHDMPPLVANLVFTYYDSDECGDIVCGYRLAFINSAGITRLEHLPCDVNLTSLAWSPDGSRLAFIAGRDASLYIMDANGSTPFRLLEGAYSDALCAGRLVGAAN